MVKINDTTVTKTFPYTVNIEQVTDKADIHGSVDSFGGWYTTNINPQYRHDNRLLEDAGYNFVYQASVVGVNIEAPEDFVPEGTEMTFEEIETVESIGCKGIDPIKYILFNI